MSPSLESTATHGCFARWARCAGAAGVLTWSASAPAQTPALVTVDVDATSAGAPIQRVWAFHGYDELNYTTAPEGKALLGSIVSAHTAAVHVRNHFLFNTGDGSPGLKWGSTGVYSEDAAGNPVYSWALTDGILDTLTGLGALPFVELGFMPQALSSHPLPYHNSSSTALDGGSFYPPGDYDKWAGLIRAWAAHVSARYPDVEARWLWELWNEPDIAYWNGTFADYAKLYDYTESALHRVLPHAVLGGPAVAGAAGSFLRQFLEHCASGVNAVTGGSGTRLDLVSFHAKGGVALVDGHVRMDLGNQLRLHRSGFTTVAAFPQFEQTPIYITEADPDGCAACPASSTPADAYRNSPAYGAYEISMMKHTLELAATLRVELRGVLAWAFTFPGTPYFDGYRALATNGIHLPVLGAFQLLGRLSGTRLAVTSSGAHSLTDLLENGMRGDAEIDALATMQGDTVQVLVWNYHDDLVPVAATPVHLSIRLPARFGARANVSHLRVDDSHGDAYTVWVSQGMPAQPSAAQLAALQQAMDPSVLTPGGSAPVPADGSLSLDFDLPRFGVSLLTLAPALATSDEGKDGGGCNSSGVSTDRGGAHPSGRSCRIGVGGVDIADSAPFGMSVLILICMLLRRRARA